MGATDEELQKLVERPICSGREEDEWSDWSFVTGSHVSLLSTHVPALLAGAEDTATSPDMRMTRIRATLTEVGATAAKKLLPRLGDEREGTSVGSHQRSHRHERSIGMASVDHEIRSKHSAASTKVHERNPHCEDLSLSAQSF